MTLATGDTLWLVDANNQIHRLYHARPIEFAPATGQPINAVTGWVSTLRRLRKSEGARFIMPIFDGEGHGWRADLFPGYKATRKPQDPELVSQWPLVRELTERMGLPLIREPEVEADDLIAAYTEAAVKLGVEVVIVSSDKDLLQLVRGPDSGPGSVRVHARGSDGPELRGPAWVRQRFGVEPALLGDLLALMGDASDSIPGVVGIGEKTAPKILADRGSLEAALAEWSLVPGRAGELLRDQADQARLSRRLVGLVDDLPLPVPLADLRPWVPSRRALDSFFAALGFARWESAVDAHRPGRR